MQGFFTINFVSHLGKIGIFIVEGYLSIFKSKRLFSKVIHYTYTIGYQSIFLIFLIGIFTGMVLGLQAFYALSMFGAQSMLGSLVSLTLVREMAPVLTAIMIAGRAGSAMTAELGMMRVTDQIDALDVMDIPSMGYLIAPRFLACLISFPLLTALFDTIGIYGGYLTSSVLLGLQEASYFSRVENAVQFADVSGGFVKSIVFAILVSGVCCFNGYFANLRKDSKGPEAVGNATTSAVVISCVLILISDYMITTFLM